MTSEQKAKCHTIIHGASIAAGGAGAGMAQIPGSDNLAIAPIQAGMAIALGKVFGIALSDSAARALTGTMITNMGGRLVARTATQILVGWIPGIGNAVNTATAASFTEALGWALAREFDEETSSY